MTGGLNPPSLGTHPVSRSIREKCLHHNGSISWYKDLSNLSGVLGLLDLELPEVELIVRI
jgi:hypothetical protein